jgi:hypothetical protein
MWTDFDNDGWPDIFVANDATPNFAYRNNHDGTFTDMALPLGLAVDENGVEQGSMGISIGDYDRDGRLDLVVTNFADQYNTIYHQNADGTYNDVSRSAGLAEVMGPYVGWASNSLTLTMRLARPADRQRPRLSADRRSISGRAL